MRCRDKTDPLSLLTLKSAMHHILKHYFIIIILFFLVICVAQYLILSLYVVQLWSVNQLHSSVVCYIFSLTSYAVPR